MQEAHKRKFDCVLVFRFDRFARSLKQLVLALDTFKSLNIDFISYQESVDTSTSGGLLMFNLIASFAQFEKSIIQERVRAGIAKARAKCKVLGRPKKDIDIDKIKQLRKEGFSIRKIAKKIGVPKTTVSKFC